MVAAVRTFCGDVYTGTVLAEAKIQAALPGFSSILALNHTPSQLTGARLGANLESFFFSWPGASSLPVETGEKWFQIGHLAHRSHGTALVEKGY